MNSHFETGVRNLIDSAIIERAAKESQVADGSGAFLGTDGFNADKLAESWQLVDEVPFDFSRRRVSVVVANGSGERVMITKGAIEEVLRACSQAELDGRLTLRRSCVTRC